MLVKNYCKFRNIFFNNRIIVYKRYFHNFLLLLLVIVLFSFISSIVFASSGFAAYRSSVNTGNPKISLWNGSANGGNGSWSTSIQLPTSGSPLRQAVIKYSPISTKVALVTLSDDGYLDAYVCIYNCTDPLQWTVSNNIGQVWTTAATQRRYDIEFSSKNGDLMVVYNNNSLITGRSTVYKVLPHANLSFNGIADNYINDTLAPGPINVSWIALDKNPSSNSNELIVTSVDFNNQRVNAWVWNGTNWGNGVSISESVTAAGNYEALAVKYVYDGSVGMVIAGNGTVGNMNYRYWNGSTWSNKFTTDINVGNNDIRWITLKSNPVSKTYQALFIDSGTDLWTSYWNGTTWISLSAAIDAALDISTTRCADFSWYPEGTFGRVIWDRDGAGTNLSQRLCNPYCNTTTLNVSAYVGTGRWITLFRNPYVNELVDFIGVRMNSANVLGSFWFNNVSNYTNYGDTVLAASSGVNTYESYGFSYFYDTMAPNITFVNITPNSGVIQSQNYVYINITSNEVLSDAHLEFNGTNYTMTSSLADNTYMIWYFNKSNLLEGFYTYKVYGMDFGNNTGLSTTRNISINFPPSIMLSGPLNNTLNTSSRNITFYYNVTDTLDNVSACSLLIDNLVVLNTTVTPVSENIIQNFTYMLINGGHNWSIRCNDTNNFMCESKSFNL